METQENMIKTALQAAQKPFLSLHRTILCLYSHQTKTVAGDTNHTPN